MMDRPYATAEQYERWFQRDCARCGRHGHFAAHWPDGHVCRTCHDRGLRIRGRCPGCGHDRILPGLDQDGASLCTACAGFRACYACSRCGTEGKLHGNRLCTRCTLADRLDELLADDNGRVRTELMPLRETLLAMDNPLSGLTWLYNEAPAELVRRLGRSDIPLTHEAFHQLEPWRAVAHLRDLLMNCGILPTIDRQMLLFERWLTAFLPSITEPDHARTIRQFATWHVLARLRARAATRPLSPSTRGEASSQVRRATEFLQWLVDNDRDLRSCTQANLDRWHAGHRGHEQRNLKPFLQWAMRTQRMPTLSIPRHQTPQRAPISQHRRLALLRRLLTDDTIALRTRVAAVLMLLYAQPLSRIVRLTTHDIVLDDDQVQLRFGTPPTPVPEPFAELILELREHRTNMRTATNPNSPWLFPGRRAGQPLHPGGLGASTREHGIPISGGRTAALRQLVLQAPAPVVASMLGYHDKHTTRIVADAGGTWSRYAPDDDHKQ